MPIARGLSLRLFLEGEEVPVISASVSVSINAPATASIQIVPLDEGMEFKPRTMVHLFFLDDRPGVSADSDYKCLFVGEIVGFNYIQSPESRGLVLQCLDHSSYWDAAHATAIEYGPGGNLFFDHGALKGANTAIFDDIIGYAEEQLLSWIKQKPKTAGLENISGLTGGIIRVMEAMGGVPKHHKGINDFFTIAELRCRLLNQISSEENDDTAKNILDEEVLQDWLSNTLQQIGQQVTFRDILKLLMSHIYYDVVPNPTPKWDRAVGGKTGRTKKHEYNLADSVKLQTALVVLQTASLDFAKVTSTDHQLTGEQAKTFNSTVLTNLKRALDDMNEAQEAKNKLSQIIASLETTKRQASIDSVRDYASIPGRLTKVIEALANAQTTTLVVPAHNTIIGATQQRLRTQFVRPDCWFVAPPRCNVMFPEQYTQLSYDRIFIGEATRTLLQLSNFITGRDQLFSVKVVAPDIGSDAKLLTSNSGEEAYRALMKHEYHTGIVLKTEWMPDSAVVKKATNPEDKKKIFGERTNWAKRSALFHFFKYRFGARTLNLSGRFNPYLVCGYPGAVILKPLRIPQDDIKDQGTDLSDFVQTIVDKQGAPTQLVGMIAGLHHSVDQNGGTTSVSMHHIRSHKGVDDEFLQVLTQDDTNTRKFHTATPLILEDIINADDKVLLELLISLTPKTDPSPPSTTTKVSTKSKTTKQKVSRDGGQTFNVEAINCVCRIEDEVLIDGLPDPTQKTKVTFSDGSIQIMYIPKKPGSKGKGDTGLFGGIIVAVEVVDLAISEVTDFIPGQSPKSRGRAFNHVILHQEVETSNNSKAPFEEIVRPGWFSDIYDNASIGEKVYNPMLGCDAVVDDLAVTGIGDTKAQVFNVPADTKAEYFKKLASDISNKTTKNSLERALNVLAYTYNKIKSQKLDIDDFIRQYTYRPIATKEQLLGSSNLSFEISGSSVKPVSTDGNDFTIGFHTMAVHPLIVLSSRYDGLLGLTEDPDTGLKRIDNVGKSEPVSKSLDVRWEKRQKVVNYKIALEAHAFQG